MQTRGRATTALSATQASLTRLGRAIFVALFMVAGFWFALVSPTGGSWAGWWAGVVCLSAAAGMWLVGERDSLVARSMRWAIPPLAIAALATIHITSELSGWWPAAEVATVGALIIAATAEPVARSVVSAAIILSAAIAPGVVMAETLGTSGGLNHYRAVQLTVIYVLPLVGVLAMRRAARKADSVGQDSEAALRAELDAAAETGAQAAVQRVLHDTVLNTLETVANGVPRDQWVHLQRRCADDLDAVNRIADVSASREVADFVEDMLALGLPIRNDFQWLADPPPLVREAVLAATAEAIRNSVRHSGADSVTVQARVSADSVLVEVADDGVGFSPIAPDRIGVRTSIMATMESVGGFALIDSAPGQGTRVSLTWDSARARVAGVLSDLRRGLILLLGAVVSASLLIFAVFTLIDSGIASPGVRLLTIAVAGVVATLLITAALRDAIDWPEFIVVVGGLGLVTMLLPLGDPYCTSFQSTSPFDLRALLMIALSLAVVTVRPLAISIVVLVLTSAVANVLWLQIGASCGWSYLLTAWVAASFAVGNFWFARTLEAQRRALAVEAITAEHELFAEAQRRARMREMAAWNGIEVTQAVALLQEIVAGAPDSPAMRRRARHIAQQVRQWLLLMGTSGPVSAVVTGLLRHWPQSPVLLLDGDPRAVDDATPAAREVATRLDAWIPRVAGATVRMTVSRTGDTASVLAHCDRPAACDDPDGWRDEDGWWLHLTWVPASALTEA